MSTDKPGGWVPEIGWVALASDLPIGTKYLTTTNTPEWTAQGFEVAATPVIVTLWDDDSVPEPPKRPDWMDTSDPHMDGSVTYAMPKHHDRPGQVMVTLPAPVVADLRRLTESSKRLPDVTELPEWQTLNHAMQRCRDRRVSIHYEVGSLHDLAFAVEKIIAAVDSRGENA